MNSTGEQRNKTWTFAERMATETVATASFTTGNQLEPGANFQDTMVADRLEKIWYVVHDAVVDAGGDPTNEDDQKRMREAASRALKGLLDGNQVPTEKH